MGGVNTISNTEETTVKKENFCLILHLLKIKSFYREEESGAKIDSLFLIVPLPSLHSV